MQIQLRIQNTKHKTQNTNTNTPTITIHLVDTQNLASERICKSDAVQAQRKMKEKEEIERVKRNEKEKEERGGISPSLKYVTLCHKSLKYGISAYGF